MYERAGGHAFFEQLSIDFYEAVAADAVLRPLYPTDEEALAASRVHLRDFLIQYWGGPSIYDETRGRPRLRMRHSGFAIGVAARDAWVTHMSAAVRRGGLRPLDEAQMLNYLSSAATHLINGPEA
ncbi:MAG: globin [Actinomycetota bacterium]|nr:globin [Actinomycetota bacterium]